MSLFKDKTLALVLAGGRGERLDPLTRERTKPSVPFGGKYRLIDFALSNLINSGIYSIYVLVQYKSQSLIEHIRTTWIKEGLLPQHFVTVVPPQMRKEERKDWYKGTADSVYQNINLIYDLKPNYVATFGADHIYRMNIKEMLNYHIRKKAKLTVSVIPVLGKEASGFGIVSVSPEGKITDFREKPQIILKNRNKKVYVSMGNYIFNADFLISILEEDAKRDTAHDFGRDIIPLALNYREDVYAYDFSTNRIPSLKRYEAKYYWRDVGTIFSYWQANMDLLGEKPLLDLNNQSWPIYASNLHCPPAYLLNSEIENSLICEGTRIYKSCIKNSIIGRGVVVEENSQITDSIVADFTYIGKKSTIKRAIIDRFNTLPKNSKIQTDKVTACKDYYVDPSGIVVIPRGRRKLLYF